MGLTGNVAPNTPIATSWGNEIRDRTLQVFANVAERTAQWVAPPEGAISYLRDVDRVEFYDGTVWKPIAVAARSWTILADVQLVGTGPISFPAIPGGYSHLQIIASLRAANNAVTDSALMRFNGDAGANYFDGVTLGQAPPGTTSVGGGARTGGALCGSCSGGTGVRFSAHRWDLPDYANTTRNKMAVGQFAVAEAAVSTEGVSNSLWISNAAVTQLDLIAFTTPNTWLAGSRATLLAI